MPTTAPDPRLPKRDGVIKSSFSGEALGSSAAGAAKGAAIGAAFGGVGAVPGAVIGGVIGGIKGMLSHRKKQAAAYDAAAKANAVVDQSNLELKRRAAAVGSLLTFMSAHPEKYGKDLKADMFGWHPGPLTEEDYKNVNAPLATQSSGLEDFLGGAAEAAESYVNNKAAAKAGADSDIYQGAFAKLGGSGTVAGRPSWASTPIGGALPAANTSGISMFAAPKRRTGLFGSG